MTANGPERAEPRWWRRSRDLALESARLAAVDAGKTISYLESLEVDLTELSSINAAAAAARTGAHRVGFTTRLSDEWDALSVRTGVPALEYYELQAAFQPGADYEEPEARRYATQFATVAAQLRELFPEVERFREVHATALAEALAVREEVPDLLDSAAAELSAASRELVAAGGQGITDPESWANHAQATQGIASARNAAAERRWVEAHRDASDALTTARQTRATAAGLIASADTVRKGYLSVRTRRDALKTRHERLPEVMSQFRRRYTYPTWQHVENAPKAVDAVLLQVDKDLASLGQVLAAQPLDVAAGLDLLTAIRTAVSDADRNLSGAIDLLSRLDAISSDPDAVLAEVRRRIVDARRFVSGLPGNESARYNLTFDNIAGRAEQLKANLAERRPDWGALLTEADAIEAALAAMIRTARAR